MKQHLKRFLYGLTVLAIIVAIVAGILLTIAAFAWLAWALFKGAIPERILAMSALGVFMLGLAYVIGRQVEREESAIDDSLQTKDPSAKEQEK